MKKLTISPLLVTLLFPDIGQPSPQNLINHIGLQKETNLEGSLYETRNRLSLGKPIYATISLALLNVDFLHSVRHIDVNIYSTTSAIVYSQCKNTQEYLPINITEWG